MKRAFKTSLKKGDRVVVITGKDKGKHGGILQVLPAKGSVLVEKVNMVKRHTKPGKDSAGGIIEKEAPVHLSNVMLVDGGSGQGTRIGKKVLEDGRKVRVARRSGEVLDA
ncbi:MAG: 50S ribosomal protein L24 [Magnetococcales bacterium]|nr:50S ribosomal protein L24 [Magnetococcales bacterium]